MKKVGIVFLVLALIGLVLTVTGQGTIAESLPLSIVFLIIGLILATRKPKNRAENATQKQGLKSFLIAKHQTGLTVAPNASCTIEYWPERFVFKSGGNDFSLPFSKMTDLSVATDVDIQSQYVSSVGGAVAGAVVFGPLGAIIGGRAKQKKAKTVTYYLIYTYLKEGEVSWITFELPNNRNNFNVNQARSWANDFKQKYLDNNNRQTIEL